MTAPIVETAQAVVDALNAASGFSQAFTAVLKYVPVYTLPDAKSLQVCVVPAGAAYGDGEAGLRSGRRFGRVDYTVHVGIVARVTQTDGEPDADEMDALLSLVDEIYAFFLADPCVGSAVKSTLMRIENEPLFDPEDLADRLFVSVLALHFRADRKAE